MHTHKMYALRKKNVDGSITISLFFFPKLVAYINFYLNGNKNVLCKPKRVDIFSFFNHSAWLDVFPPRDVEAIKFGYFAVCHVRKRKLQTLQGMFDALWVK